MQIAKVQVGEQHGKYSKTRIYVHPQGETLLENLSIRRARPHTVYRKEVLPKLFTVELTGHCLWAEAKLW